MTNIKKSKTQKPMANELAHKSTLPSVLAVSSPKEIVRAKPVSLAAIRKDFGVVAQVFVEGCLNDALLLIRAGKSISDKELPAIASLILQKYYWYSREDVQLCIRMGISGDFGKNYDVFDAQTILGWFAKYDEMRTSEALSIKDYKVDGSQNNIAQVFNTEAMKQVLESVNDSLKMRTIAEDLAQVRNEPDNMQRIVALLHDEFNELRDVNNLVKYGEKTLDLQGYLKVRIKEIQNQTK